MSKIAAPLGGVIMSNQPSEVGGRQGGGNGEHAKREKEEERICQRISNYA